MTRSHRGQPTDIHQPDGVRLQKVLASAGLGSRRACEELITSGRVTVNDTPVRELGVRVDPSTAIIHVDGMRVQLDTTKITLVLNKPRGVISTMSDPDGRPCLDQFVSTRESRLFHVGRLDAESEGLLILTNDGDLAHQLAHPAREVPKTYLITIDGMLPHAARKALQAGVELDDGLAKVDSLQIKDTSPVATMIEVVIHSGRNRILRRMFDAVGYPITRLVRTKIGPIALGNQRPGTTRVLSRVELGSLMKAVGM